MDRELEKRSTKNLKKGALVSYLTIGFSIISRLIYTPLIIKLAGQTNYALYALALSLISILVMDYGLSSTVSRYISNYRANNEEHKIESFLGIIIKIYFVIDFLLIIFLTLVFFNLGRIYPELTVSQIEAFKIPFIIVSVYGVITFPFIPLNGILFSYEETFLLKLCGAVQKVFFVIIIVVSLIFKPDLYFLVLAPTISGILYVILKFIVYKKRIPIKIDYSFKDKSLLKEVLVFTFWTSIITLALRLIPILSPSLLGAWAGAASIAIYSIASGIENYVYTFANAINGMFMPKVSRRVMHEDGDVLITRLMINVGRIILLILTLIYLGIILLGKEFISLWVGLDYLPAYQILLLILAPGYIFFPEMIGNSVVLARNKIRKNAYILSLVLLIYLACSYFLVKSIGLLGIGLAIFIANTVRNILVNILYHKECGIDIKLFFKEVHLKLIIQSAIIGLISYFVFTFFDGVSWVNFLSKGIILVIVYGSVMWLFGLNKNEKNLLIESIKTIRDKLLKKK
jgi:O-antigen/teichoic acid export membrane protein